MHKTLYIVNHIPIFTLYERQAVELYNQFKAKKLPLDTVLYQGKVYKGLISK